jgi:adenine-specific DNA-methyltransferase
LSAIDDLIARVQEPSLREQFKREWAEAQKTRKFGLVFDRHLPELVPIPKARPRRDDLVARKGGSLTDLWRVRRVSGGMAHCVRPEGTPGAGDPWDWPLDELVVVRQFGEPIFPALVPMDQVQNGPADAPWHCLIEADNFHALQLLAYLYAGKVDCIYIDPPYNTGARDWKYNNDYVDGNDSWRHSKWLSFMEKRLRLAKRLLNPATGVLIVTIDEHEVHHLGMLLEREFPEAYRQMVTVVINPKGVTQGRFSRVEEYALFCFAPQAFVKSLGDDLLSAVERRSSNAPRWKGLLRSGTNARRRDRHKMFFPVLIDQDRQAVIGAGDYLPLGQDPDIDARIDGYIAAWPVRTDGTFGNWGVGPESLRDLIAQGYVALGRYDANRKTWGISYLSRKLQLQIKTGAIQVVEFDEKRNVVKVEYAEERERQIKAVWHRSTHDAGAYGADILRAVLGEGRKFSFPKSLYATRDAVASVVRDLPKAVIVDFFAGSGTTLNAVNLLNATDGGYRHCILVTNNEVSGEGADSLRGLGLTPGDNEWEQLGICRSVTWPRSKFTILGKRDDGTRLPGDYLTGRTVERQRLRRVTQIGFVDPGALDRSVTKKQLVALIEGLPQTLVTDPCPFIVSADHKASVLFDEGAGKDWLAALDGQDHITDLYIVTKGKVRFDTLRDEVHALLGPVLVPEEETRPLADGFAANLAYFRLEFLDKDRVALKRAFREILPLLWLKAGAIGPRPELPPKRDQAEAEPTFFAPPDNPFAVLLDEGSLKALLAALADRSGLRCVFIVTDSGDAFKEMAAEVTEALGPKSPALTTVQLYRDYLENFLINTDRIGADRPDAGNQGGTR